MVGVISVCTFKRRQFAASDTSVASPILAPAEMVAESINSPMRSGPKSHLLCAAVGFLAACQSPPVNQRTQPNKPASTAAQPTTPSSYEVNSFDPLQREPGLGLRGSSYFGRGAVRCFLPGQFSVDSWPTEHIPRRDCLNCAHICRRSRSTTLYRPPAFAVIVLTFAGGNDCDRRCRPQRKATPIVNVTRVIAFALSLFGCPVESKEGRMRRA